MKKHQKHWSRALSLFLTVFMAVQLITPAVAVQAQPTMEDELVAESILQDENKPAQPAEETQSAEEAQTTEEAQPAEEPQTAEETQPAEDAQPAEEPQAAEDTQSAEEPQEAEVPQSEETTAPAEEPAEPQVFAAQDSQYEYVEVKTEADITSGGTYAVVYTTDAAATQGNILYHANTATKTDQVTARFANGKMSLDDTNRFPEKTQTWIIAKVDGGGYTIRSCSADNQYLNLNKTTSNSQDVPVSGTAQTLQIVAVNGGMQISGTSGDQTFYLAHESTGHYHVGTNACTMRLFKKVERNPAEASKDALKAAIQKAGELEKNDYTEASKAALETAVTAGNAELENQAATKESVEKATAAITKAMQAMTPKADLMAPDRPNPDHGTTEGEPFPAGIGGSDTFRIPSLITLNDGSLAAAIDARWDYCPDGFSIDTLFSRSTDGGKTWHYTFPNYFNDSVDQYWGGDCKPVYSNKGYATAFIDPVMTQGKDGTIYLMVDLFPGGTYIGNASVDSGYEVIDGKERLAIHYSHNGRAGSYDFYVSDFKDGYAPLIAKGDSTKSAAYYVDEHYNLYTADKKPMYCKQLGTGKQPWSGKYVQQNVFYYNAEVHVRSATYLWMVTSKDNGATWSAPTIMNPMVRERPAHHQFYGVGPGAGLCLDDGTVMLPCYVHGSERSSFIYKNPNENTWHRSQNASSDTSSESTLVQIDKDTVRQFCRDGHNVLRYTDHKRNAEGKWIAQEPVRVEGVYKTQMNQLSAIRYSEEINGKPVILVSTAATGNSGRFNGKIYAFNLEDDAGRTMKLIGTYEVNKPGETYGYSSLTELPDGSIGLMYEDTWIHAGYHNILLNEIIPDAVVNGKRTVSVTMYDTKEDPFKFQTLPTAEELAQMDSTIATGEIVNGKVVYTGQKAGQTSYTSGGVTITIRVTEPASVQEVPLTIGQSEEIAVESGKIQWNTNPDAVEAKITVDDKSQTVNGGQCHIGTDASYNGELKPLAMGLHVFEQNGDGFQIFGKDADGNKVWLNPAAGLGTPMSDKPVQVQFEQQTDGTFFIKSGGRYLAFWRNGNNVFDAGSSAAGGMTALCKFKLYRPAATSESSAELPGYVQVTKLADIQNGGMYLIVAEYNHENYILWPSLDGVSKHAHVAKADKNEKNVTYTVDNKYYTLTLTGKAVGTSDVVVNDVVYRVTVTCEHEFGTEWKHDETSHWHECSCGAKQDEAAHTFGDWTVTKEATESEAGLKVHRCTVCGYEETVEIPVIPVDPDTPVNPDVPVNPDTPVNPTEPTNPTNPTEPAAPHQGATPATGDSSQVLLWIVMVTISGLCLAAIVVYGKKKHHA